MATARHHHFVCFPPRLWSWSGPYAAEGRRTHKHHLLQNIPVTPPPLPSQGIYVVEVPSTDNTAIINSSHFFPVEILNGFRAELDRAIYVVRSIDNTIIIHLSGFLVFITADVLNGFRTLDRGFSHGVCIFQDKKNSKEDPRHLVKGPRAPLRVPGNPF